MRLHDIKRVYAKSVTKDGRVRHQLVGKFLDDGKTVAVIHDHAGLLSDLPHEGPKTPELDRRLRALHASSYLYVVGLDHEPAPPSESPAVKREQIIKARPPSKFLYRGAGMQRDHRLEFHDGDLHLDGHALAPAEAKIIMDGLEAGRDKIRYAPTLAKAEDGAPGPPTLSASLEAMKSAVAAGHVPQEHYDRIRRELFEDDAVPGIGNTRAFREHQMGAGRAGTTISLDLNGLKGVNDLHGHDAGDHFIRSAGEAMRRAVDKTVTSDAAKVFRKGGDEFAIHAQSPEHAHVILRQLHHELSQVPPVGGTHRLSVSAGIGNDFATADKALYHAKAAKLDAIKATGADPGDRTAGAPHATYVHSLVPGQEGAVPHEPAAAPTPKMPAPG